MSLAPRSRAVLRASAILTGVTLLSLASLASSAGAAMSHPSTLRASMFYLDIGGSASIGFQPTATDYNGRPSDHGYANYLVADEARHGLALHLVQTGCPGETTLTMLYGGGHCHYAAGTQLRADVAFLQAHWGERGLVTVDLGFNDVYPCLRQASITSACVAPLMTQVATELPVVMATLRAAAGPRVIFVGVGHYDPFLANALEAPPGPVDARASLAVVEQLNATIATAYARSATPLAKVAAAFRMTDVARARFGRDATVLNVVRACTLTWMCRASDHPNMHPDDAGYRAIADAIAVQVEKQLALVP